MDNMVRQRLVGAVVMSVLAAILLPLLFGNPKDPRHSIRASFSGTPVPGAATSLATPLVEVASRNVAAPATPTPRPRATARPTPRPTSKPTPRATPRPTPMPTPRVTPRPTPKATPVPSPASGWVLQLASYGDKKAADAFLSRLRRDGYQAYLESGTVNGRTYYRVRMGLSMSRKEAEAIQAQVEKRYKLKAKLY